MLSDLSQLKLTFKPLLMELQANSSFVAMGRVIVYCKTLDDCCAIHDYLNSNLGEKRLFPPGSRDLSQNRIVDMYVSITDNLVKSSIVSSFTQPSSTLKVN